MKKWLPLALLALVSAANAAELIKVGTESEHDHVLHDLSAQVLLEVGRTNPAAATALSLFLPGSAARPVTLANGSASATRAPTFATVQAVLGAQGSDDAVATAVEATRQPEREDRLLQTRWQAVPESSRYAIRFETYWRARNSEGTLLGKAFPSVLIYVSESKPRRLLGWSVEDPGLGEEADAVAHRFTDALMARDIPVLVRMTHPRLTAAFQQDGEHLENALKAVFDSWDQRRMQLDRVEIGAPRVFSSESGELFLFPIVRDFVTFEGRSRDPLELLVATHDGGRTWHVIYLDCLSDAHIHAIAPDYVSTTNERLTSSAWRAPPNRP